MIECWKWRSVIGRRAAACVVVAATSFGAAAPARADERTYLDYLDQRWAFVSAEQLLYEGHKACNFIRAGNTASDAIHMVAADLKSDVIVATEIVRNAVVQFDC